MHQYKENSNGKVVPVRILIADDTQETRRSTRLMLATISNVEIVAMAQNGRQAVEMILHHRPDVVIIDINMPGLSGIQALQKIRPQLPDLACIFISVERDTRTLRQAIRAGAQAYLTKPFTSDELRTALHRVRDVVWIKRRRLEQLSRLRQQRDVYLQELAQEYIKARRADEKAMVVFEQLAENPNCDLYLLKTLAVIYVFRHQWEKLNELSKRLTHEGVVEGAQHAVSVMS